MTTITSICLICNRIYETKDGKGVSGVSHGYCPNCQKIVLAEMGMSEDEFHDENGQ